MSGSALHPHRAHYVIREPRADFTRVDRPQVYDTGVFGPASTNFPNNSVRLPNDTVGVLDAGQRFLVIDSRVAAVADNGGFGPLDAFLQVPGAFGGGFVFLVTGDAYFAKTFTAPLVRLGEHPASQFRIGPGYAFVTSADGFTGFVGLKDGKAIANAPSNFQEFWAHPGGFLLGATPTGVLFGTSLDTWRELPLQDISMAVADQSGFVILDAQERAFRVSSDGRVSAISAHEGINASTLRSREFEGQWRQVNPTTPGGSAREGSLLDQAWAPTLRADDEWYGVQDDQVYVLNTRSNTLRAIGPKLATGDASCGPKVLSGEPLLICATLGSRLRVWRLNLESGARSLETEVHVTKGFASQIGDAPAYYPQTLFISSSCLGDALGGLCIRDRKGSYATYRLSTGRSMVHTDVRGGRDAPASENQGAPFIFPGELLRQRIDSEGALTLFRDSDAAQYHFDAKTLREASTAMHWTDAANATGMSAFSGAGALRTPTGLRVFNIPNPFQPVPPAPVSYALELSLDGTGQVRLLRAPGIVAAAGAHGLRLDRGKLYETNDGWSTWYEVDPPASGVPKNLAGAHCDERGCVLGPWARIGWERPNAFTEL